MDQVALSHEEEDVHDKDEANSGDVAQQQAQEQGANSPVQSDAADFQEDEFDEPGEEDGKGLVAEYAGGKYR